MVKGDFIVKNLTLTAMTNWLNEVFKEKSSGQKFQHYDVQGYIRRGKLPDYLGGNEIERNEGITHAKLYNIKESK